MDADLPEVLACSDASRATEHLGALGDPGDAVSRHRVGDRSDGVHHSQVDARAAPPELHEGRPTGPVSTRVGQGPGQLLAIIGFGFWAVWGKRRQVFNLGVALLCAIGGVTAIIGSEAGLSVLIAGFWFALVAVVTQRETR